MQLTYKIVLCQTPEQADYFVRACDTVRKIWNWALDEWSKQYAAEQKLNAVALKKQFNAIKHDLFLWLKDIHCVAHLGKVWSRFFADIKVANDKFTFSSTVTRLPKVGEVAMHEALRFDSKLLGATVSRTVDRWFVAIQVKVREAQYRQRRAAHGTIGVNLGILDTNVVSKTRWGRKRSIRTFTTLS